MIILFTGHRDCTTTQAALDEIANTYPDATWLLGDADGFDSQVSSFASANHITQQVIELNDELGDAAPLIRAREMVNMLMDGDLVVACYDGRQTGGTLYTMNYARAHHHTVKQVIALNSTAAIS